MTVKERFLAIQTAEEYNNIRYELKGLDWNDEEVRVHSRKILKSEGVVNGRIVRCYDEKPTGD